MPTLIENLNQIESIKTDIRSAIQDKGVDMTGVSFPDYPSKIGEIQTGGTFVTETLSVSVNNTYYPGEGVDGFSEVVVNVPQNVDGYDEKEITERIYASLQTLSNSASFVGSFAFYNTSLQTVYLPNCTYIRDDAFENCNRITSVDCPECTNIGLKAFYNDSNLSNVSIKNVVDIGSSAFYKCKISQISLPECTIIRNQGFGSCPIENIYLPKCLIIDTNVFSNCVSLSYVELPLVRSIGMQCFFNCTTLSYISIPQVESIGNSALYNTKIEHISLPKIKSFGTNVFRNCTSLVDITLGTETYHIANYQNNLFSGTNFLTNGTIYVDAAQYNRWVTATGWSSISSLFVSIGTSEPMLSYSDGLVYGKTPNIGTDFYGFLGINKDSVNQVDLPLCSLINKSTFNGCSYLTQISFPMCEEIIESAFYNCYRLTEVSLPVCKVIGAHAFHPCALLSQVSLPECEYIGESGFYGCDSLTQLYLPACKEICSFAFYYTHISQISLPVCEIIGIGAFTGFDSGCPITEVNLPACKELGHHAFKNCPITYVSLPVCEKVDYNVFENLHEASIYLPVCSYIGMAAFSTYSSITITLGYNNVVSCDDPFNSNRKNVSIYVPASLVDAYKSANVWSNYSSHIFPIPE